MRVLRQGMTGEDVGHWQAYLRGRGLYLGAIDDSFGPGTAEATRTFQRLYNLRADGVVGPDSYCRAMNTGFDPTTDDSTEQSSPNWPPKPSFRPLATDAERAALFGSFHYKPAGDPKDPEAIIVLDGWYQAHIELVEIPQLSGVLGAPKSLKFPFHKLVAAQVQGLFKAWEDAGLLNRIRAWAGSYAARFVRGRRDVLSNHAFGTAFDINVPWNGLGAQPALVGAQGCVRELVPIANEHGIYWGGHFQRKDGMHFEVAQVES